MKIVENFQMIDAGKGRIPCLRKITTYNEKKKSFAGRKMSLVEGEIRYDTYEQYRVLVRPSTIRRMEGLWDEHTFYAYKRHKMWWAIIFNEGQLFRVKYTDFFYDENSKPRSELFQKVMDKEISAFDALMLVSL